MNNTPMKSSKPRKRTLKVFIGNYDGVRERMIASYTKAEAIKISGVGSAYIGVTGNQEVIKIAMSKPGVVFKRLMLTRDAEWEETIHKADWADLSGTTVEISPEQV